MAAPTKKTEAPSTMGRKGGSPTTDVPELSTNIHNDPVEVDESDDRDSSYAESVSSESYLTSLRSSIRDYKFENGRRYHAFHEGAYPMPNDEEEQDRLDLLHHLYLLLLDGGLHRAPLPPKLGRVLDLGTGTGLWAITFADDHPETEVVGTDLSPIQPAWVPPNCSFEIDDFEADWVFSRPFDYIHARELHGSISDPMRLCSQMYRALNPDGWVEFQMGGGFISSDDGTHERAKRTLEWFDLVCGAAEQFGKPIRLMHRMKQYLLDTGFVDVEEFIGKAPVHSWPKSPKLKQIGRIQEVHMLQAYNAYTPGFCGRVLGWDKAATDAILADCHKELFDRSLHAYVPVYFVYGRKPT